MCHILIHDLDLEGLKSSRMLLHCQVSSICDLQLVLRHTLTSYLYVKQTARKKDTVCTSDQNF